MPESEKEKTDRQLVELLNELRVALPGAQVLLAFLLTAPFATRFGRASRLDHALLFTCTVVTGVAVVLLLAPSVYHRMRWNEGGKQDVIRVGHRLFLGGDRLPRSRPLPRHLRGRRLPLRHARSRRRQRACRHRRNTHLVPAAATTRH